jgi:oxygen-independent coproporphyrinogen III oxidase
MAGVYISYPFCLQKCTYCNFASGVFPRGTETEYLTALEAEIAGAKFAWTPETVYLGGGTPSLLTPDQLKRVLGKIPGGPWKEATLEAAPGSITPEKAAGWRNAGINRVSLGVQSFVQPEIARTGRKHTAEIVESDVKVLGQAGIASVNVDLIAGLAGQTRESWLESLEWIGKLRPAHVSVYMLEVDEDSRLGSEIILGGKRFGASDIPSDERIVEFYQMARDYLHGMGIEQYEISNFAKPGEESLHNLKYWLLEPYIGVGADAHSFDGSWRWQNVESPGEYVRRFQESKPFVEERTAADPQQERFFVGLRLMRGIVPSAEDREKYDEPIRDAIDRGLLEMDGPVLRLTPFGVLFSNEVFQEFI